MFKMSVIISIVMIIFSHSHAAKVSLNLNEVRLIDAIYTLGKLVPMNIVINTEIEKTISMHIEREDALQTLDNLLKFNNLSRYAIGNTWYIISEKNLLSLNQAKMEQNKFLLEHAPIYQRTWLLKYTKALDFINMIKDGHDKLLSPRGSVYVSSRTNHIIVYDTDEKLKDIEHLVHIVDVPSQQVLIEARLVSINCDYERALGISTAINNKIEFSSSTEHAYTLQNLKLPTLDVKLAALEREGHARIISSPSLFTENLKTAEIEAGEEVPYQEVSESGGTAVAFKKAVLCLKVVPHILPGKKVLMELKIIQDRPNKQLVLGMPTISTRQIVTNVLTKTGETIVLGGIYEANQENASEGMPFLSHLPIIGPLFKQKTHLNNKRELLIFVTPKIMG